MNGHLMKRSAFVFALLMLAVMPFAQAQVAVGDILCSDGQILTTSTYPSSGATAIGVVFYVDGTGQHGWAVALQDAGSFAWGAYGSDTPLGNYTNKRKAIYDLDGYENTRVVREHSTNHPAFYAVDFEDGWYVPAIGQLNYLYGNLIEVNTGLNAAGGTPFNMEGDWIYWSSTEYSSVHAWYLYRPGELNNYDNGNNGKSLSRRVRGVINF
jgi:hypothetical protein